MKLCISSANCSEDSNILKICYEDKVTESSFCDCDNLLGYSGIECTELSAQGVFLELSTLSLIFILVGYLAWQGLNLANLYANWNRIEEINETSTVQFDLLGCVFLTIISLVSVTIERTWTIAAHFSDYGYEISQHYFVFSSAERIEESNQLARNLLLSMHTLFTFFSILTVCLYLKHTAKAFQLETIERNFKKRFLLLYVLIGMTVCLTILLRLVTITAAIEGIVAMCIFVFFKHIRKEVLFALLSFQQNKSYGLRGKKFIVYVNRIFFVSGGALVLHSLASFIFFISFPHNNKFISPDHLNYHSVLIFIRMLTTVVILGSSLNFLAKFINKPKLLLHDKDDLQDSNEEQSIEYFQPHRRISLSRAHVTRSIVKIDHSQRQWSHHSFSSIFSNN